MFSDIISEFCGLLMQYLVACESDVEPLSGSILNLHIEIRPNARQCSQLYRMPFSDNAMTVTSVRLHP